MKEKQLEELLYQALETELGGVEVYTTALRCVVNDELKEEWQKYLDQTRNHVKIVQDVLSHFDLDLEKETPGRKVVRHTGESLVKAMQMALESGEPEAAEVVAAECIVLAETKDHLNWQLIGEAAKKATGEKAKALKAAHEEVEDGGGRAPVPHCGLGARTLDQVFGNESCAAAAGRSQGCQDSDWRGSGSARARRDVALRSTCLSLAKSV